MSADLSAEEHARWWSEAGFGELRQILFWVWDPIGVQDGFPTTAGEYDGCALTLCSRLRAGMTATDVAEFLSAVALDEMGVDVMEADPERIGARIVAWFAASTECWRTRPHRSSLAGAYLVDAGAADEVRRSGWARRS